MTESHEPSLCCCYTAMPWGAARECAVRKPRLLYIAAEGVLQCFPVVAVSHGAAACLLLPPYAGAGGGTANKQRPRARSTYRKGSYLHADYYVRS